MDSKDENRVKERPDAAPSLVEAEGKPWMSLVVGIAVVIVVVLACFVNIDTATVFLIVVSLAVTTMRLILRKRSPWKIRSVAFDCFIGYAFSIGLLVTFISILMLGS
jgi:uncharacterized membrane protein